MLVISRSLQALSYCKPRTVVFGKLQSRLVHAKRVQSEVRRVGKFQWRNLLITKITRHLQLLLVMSRSVLRDGLCVCSW